MLYIKSCGELQTRIAIYFPGSQRSIKGSQQTVLIDRILKEVVDSPYSTSINSQ